MVTRWPSTGPTTVSPIEPSGSRPQLCRRSSISPLPHPIHAPMIPQQNMMNDALSPHTPSPLPADADATVTGTDIVYLADLQPQPVVWLWQQRLAAGTLAMLSGDPGSGKTWVALASAAALTRGRDPFTGEKLKPATVLYASAEHPAAQVIQPRFAGLHGDPARLVILRRALSASSVSSPDSALRDLEELQRRKIRRFVVDFAALRRMSALRSTRQDAQINYLSTLSILRKQTTYLATLPKRSRKLLNSIYPISCISSPPQNRHPERSASQIYRKQRALWRGVEEPVLSEAEGTPAMLVGRCASELSGRKLQRGRSGRSGDSMA
jgi:hypothetical protein